LRKEFEIRFPLSRTLGNASAAPDIPERGTKGPELIGPAPLPFYKLRGHFRWHVMLKIPREPKSTSEVDFQVLRPTRTPEIYRVLMSMKKPAGVAFQLDVDPLNIL
jgi:primosomal protein N'